MVFYKVKEQLKFKVIFNRYNGIRTKLLILKKYDKIFIQINNKIK